MNLKITIKKIILFICLFTIIFNTSIVFAENTIETNDNANAEITENLESPKKVEPDLISKNAFLFDIETGKVLYSKDAEKRVFPASTTKILTAILTLENCNLSDIVTITHDIDATIPYGYTIVELRIGEQFTIEQLLEILMVHSGNDVANLLAEHVGGSLEGFAQMMNAKINELGLTNTHFTNPSGIHDDNHYTTAKDLAMIMEYCIRNDNFRKFASLPSCNIPETNKHPARIYESTNKLIIPSDSNYYPYLVCGKTGYTTEAGQCLVSYAKKDNLNLICVVLGGEVINGVSTRFDETKKLYEYGYNNYSRKNIINKDDFVTQIDVKNGAINERNLSLNAKDSITTLIANDIDTSSLEGEVNLQNDIKAPIEQGDVLGSISYVVDENTYTVDLIASHAVNKSYLIYYMIEILIGIVLIVIVYLIFSHFIKKKKTENKN